MKFYFSTCTHSNALLTYMTAGTHGGLACWTKYPKIGSVISSLFTVLQQDASFSAKDG